MREEEDQWLDMFNKQVQMNQQQMDYESRVHQIKKSALRDSLDQQCQQNLRLKSKEKEAEAKEVQAEMQLKKQQHQHVRWIYKGRSDWQTRREGARNDTCWPKSIARWLVRCRSRRRSRRAGN